MILKAKAFAHNREIDMEIEISEEELARLTAITETKKDTGYGFGNHSQLHYTIHGDGSIQAVNSDTEMEVRDLACNLYHNAELARDDARADLLMRKLRRFAAEHNQKKIDWHEPKAPKYIIQYHNETGHLYGADWYNTKVFGSIYFDAKETSQLAIDTFHDELLWYFTEYNK